MALQALATAQLAIGQVAAGSFSFPVVAIALLAALLIAGMLRLYDLDWPIALLLLLGIAFTVYEYYWEAVLQWLRAIHAL